ncbi:MAG: DUF362 domain-containing protein [Clostridia bacterium]|nr:DUF362 domain-containing protein [Clostridia bacterium]
MKTEPVAVASCREYEVQTVKAVLADLIGKIDGFAAIRPGMRVGIKANLVAAGKPETAITTHPAVLAALCELLIERGASVVVGDSAGGPWTAPYMNHIYSVSGMEAVTAAGGEMNGDFSEAEASFPEAVQAKSFRYTGWLDRCDTIINVCKVKSHGMMALSNAVKNLFGTVPGILKPEYHYRYPNPNDFADMIVDIADYWKPVLHIADGIVAMQGNGPTRGTPYPLGALLVSKNPHLLDRVTAELLGLSVDDIPTLQAAKRRGYLPDRFSDITVIGDWESLRADRFERILNRNSTLFAETDTAWGRLKRRVITAALGSKPVVKRAECVGCRQCEKICPAKAITMQKGIPVIDRKQCIRCFCCQEFCPKGAMKVHRSPIAKLVNH